MPFPYELLTGGEALDKLRILSRATGPSDCWRAQGDRTAAFGNTLSAHAWVEAGVQDSMSEHWFCGIKLELRPVASAAELQDYPSARNQPEIAAAELGRLAPLGTIH